MRNTYTGTLAVKALATTTVKDAVANGEAIDLAQGGNNFRDVLFIVHTGTVTDGDFEVTVEESDTSNSGFADVADHRILGALPTFDDGDDNTWKSFGVRPTKRYVRVVVTPSDAETGGAFSATAVLAAGSNTPPVTA